MHIQHCHDMQCELLSNVIKNNSFENVSRFDLLPNKIHAININNTMYTMFITYTIIKSFYLGLTNNRRVPKDKVEDPFFTTHLI
ncbi:hypothetical protein EB077_10015 [bacterium]|nr:hypothetical protein [bacterium]